MSNQLQHPISTKRRLERLHQTVLTVLKHQEKHPMYCRGMPESIVRAELYLLEQEQRRFEEGTSDAGE